MAQALAAVHAAANGEHFALEVGRHADSVALYFRTGRQLGRVFQKQLASAYPDVTIARLSEQAHAQSASDVVQRRRLILSPDMFAIESCDAFEDRLSRELVDPLASVFGVIAADGDPQRRVKLILDLTPAPAGRKLAARRILDRYCGTTLSGHYRRGRWYLAGATSPRRWRRICAMAFSWCFSGRVPAGDSRPAAYEKLGQPLFTAELTLEATAETKHAALRLLDQLESSLAPFSQHSDASFKPAGRGGRRGWLLSVDELAVLWHPPMAAVNTERLARTVSRTFEPPTVLPDPARDDGVPLGRVDFRERHETVVLKTDDRRRHLYIVGKTGVGKSTMMLNMLAHDIQHGRGVGLIDPHGDLAADVLARVPSRRTNDVVWFDPASACVAFNPLHCRTVAERPLVAAGVLTAMKKVFAVDEQHSPRLLYILRNVLLALVEQPQATLLDIPRMLADGRFRQQMIARLEDQHVRTFWTDEFASWNDRYRTEAVAPIQNKVGQFLSSPLLRAVFASPASKLNLRSVIDDGKILLVNLSHGRLGEDSAALLGALLVTSLQQAAMSRADMPEAARRDFFLYADEFQTYAGTESLEVILSQARKYRLSLCLANQLVGQMNDSLAATVFGNCGSLCVLQVGRTDAEALALELGGDVQPEDLIAIPKHTAVVRQLIDGEPTRPFSIRTLMPPPVVADRLRQETIKNASAKRYAAADRIATSA